MAAKVTVETSRARKTIDRAIPVNTTALVEQLAERELLLGTMGMWNRLLDEMEGEFQEPRKGK